MTVLTFGLWILCRSMESDKSQESFVKPGCDDLISTKEKFIHAKVFFMFPESVVENKETTYDHMFTKMRLLHKRLLW